MRRVAVLGAGIMGSSTALLLARRGVDVTLFDAASRPFSAASRWNEGKIHLGYMYSADSTLKTAGRVIPGGLLFRPLLEELLDCSLASVTTPTDDIYLCHRMSVVDAEAMQHHYAHVDRMVRQHPDAGHYLADVSGCRSARLTSRELAAVSDSPDIVCGFRVPERSVATNWVADRFVAALSAEQRIEQRMDTRVTAVRPGSTHAVDGSWLVESSDGAHGPYEFVINALWEGRLPIDATAGLKPTGVWSNRYRLALFLRTTEPVEAPSAVIATGPFGDIKNYNGRDFYLSWYPEGLMVDSADLVPPPTPMLDKVREQQLGAAIVQSLVGLLPWIGRIRDRVEQKVLAGGWVFAAGQGALSDPALTLHRRSDFGISRLGSYLSIDTGKYSTAPWLARKLVDSIA